MEARLVAVERELGHPLPRAVRQLYADGDGRFNPSGQWWVIWPLERLVPENVGAWARGLPETFLAFGDDGTGNPFCIEHDGGSLEVWRWNWIDLAFERSEGQLTDFLAAWIDPPP